MRLITSSHGLGPSERRAGPSESKPLSIGPGCWIGSGAVILPGVTVAPGCIVGAGAVVSRDTRPDGLYAGIPARRIKDLQL
ncbi:DapH/DapD/GlmU-related protein [Agreia sp. PsM10]|uniref:DapH/DapD/GlmU-related protein n=1 Tax=Agreia sp. PsM10 TaxID=3030533 RepID=UPI00345E3F71